MLYWIIHSKVDFKSRVWNPLIVANKGSMTYIKWQHSTNSRQCVHQAYRVVKLGQRQYHGPWAFLMPTRSRVGGWKCIEYILAFSLLTYWWLLNKSQTKWAYILNRQETWLIGCPTLHDFQQITLSKKYVIPIYKKRDFPNFQSFLASSSVSATCAKNTKYFKNL